jgi:hypothetical protein
MMLEANRAFERKHAARTCELKGLMRCGCGLMMKTRTAQPKGGRRYHYYECKRSSNHRQACSSFQKAFRAQEVEAVMRSFVSDLLRDPERIRAGMQALIEQERANGPRDLAKEAATWAQKIEKCTRLRSAYQDQQATGPMTLEELGSNFLKLDETRELAQAELDALALREQRVEDLEADRDTLVKDIAVMVPGGPGQSLWRRASQGISNVENWGNTYPGGLPRKRGARRAFVKQLRRLPVGLLLQSTPLTS